MWNGVRNRTCLIQIQSGYQDVKHILLLFLPCENNNYKLCTLPGWEFGEMGSSSLPDPTVQFCPSVSLTLFLTFGTQTLGSFFPLFFSRCFSPEFLSLGSRCSLSGRGWRKTGGDIRTWVCLCHFGLGTNSNFIFKSTHFVNITRYFSYYINIRRYFSCYIHVISACCLSET